MRKIIIIIFILISQLGIGQTSIPFRDRSNIPLITIELNGKPANLLIDTGASMSFIDYRYSRKYDFEVLGEFGEIKGIGSRPNILYDTKGIIVKYKDLDINIRFKSMDLSQLREAIGVIGVLGADWFVKNRATIDFKNKLILIN